MVKKKDDSKRGSQEITSEMLSMHASALTSVLYRLRKDYSDLTTDDLWSAIREHWDVQAFQNAIRNAKQNLRPFKSLIKLATTELPRADKDGFIYIRGRRYGTIVSFSRLKKITYKSIRVRIKGCTTISGRDYAGFIHQFYLEADIDKYCKDLLDINDIADDTGFITHKRKRWGTVRSYQRSLHLSERAIQARIHSLPCLNGKVHGKKRKFYEMHSVRSACKDILTSPKTPNGFFREDKVQWGNKNVLAKALCISVWRLKTILKYCRSRKGIGQYGGVITYYSLQDAKKAKKQHIHSLPHTHKDGFINFNKQAWGSFHSLSQTLNLGIGLIKSRCRRDKTIKSIQGINRRGNVDTFYNLNDVKRALKTHLSTSRIGRNGFFIKKGKKWGPAVSLSKYLHIPRGTISKYTKWCKAIPGINLRNCIVPCYELNDVKSACTKARQTKFIKSDPITPADLKRYASTLSRVLYELRQKHPSLTSDQMWKKITKRWSSKQLASAVAAYRKTKRITQFQSLLES